MKVILWATLTANGNYAASSAEHPPKSQALEDFAGQVRQTGNFIVGRKTFEGFAAGGSAPFQADTVVVSRQPRIRDGVLSATSPEQALALLREKGYDSALVAGGEALHNAFLAARLVDELIILVAPVLEGPGFRLELPQGQFEEARLLEVKDLGGVIRLHYSLR